MFNPEDNIDIDNKNYLAVTSHDKIVVIENNQPSEQALKNFSNKLMLVKEAVLGR